MTPQLSSIHPHSQLLAHTSQVLAAPLILNPDLHGMARLLALATTLRPRDASSALLPIICRTSVQRQQHIMAATSTSLVLNPVDSTNANVDDAHLCAGRLVLGLQSPLIYAGGYEGFTDITPEQSLECPSYRKRVRCPIIYRDVSLFGDATWVPTWPEL